MPTWALNERKLFLNQPRRKRGISKNNFYTLYDLAMLGITNYTKIPLRLATMFGFLSAVVSFFIGFAYLIYKFIFWYEFSLGSAPLVIGLFFLGSIQLMFLGIVGEYIGAIYTQVMHRPLVIEKERIDFLNQILNDLPEAQKRKTSTCFSRLMFVISVLLAALFLYLALRGLDWPNFFVTLKNPRYVYLPITLLWSTASFFMRALSFTRSGEQ